jgi:5-methylcytosine-specific restriction endonuclease McrA
MKWRQIKGFRKFDVNHLGQVKNAKHGYIVEPFEKDGDLYVKIPKDVNEYECLVAHLVLTAFEPSFRVGCKINFKDGNRLNCCQRNLSFTRKIFTNFSGANVDEEEISHWRCETKVGSIIARALHHEIVDKHDIYRILQIHRFRCFYCQEILDCATWQVDHFIPLSKGGSSLITNLVPSCRECNMMKSDLLYDQMVKLARKIVKIYDSFLNTAKQDGSSEQLTTS